LFHKDTVKENNTAGNKKHSMQKITNNTTPITEPNTNPIHVIISAIVPITTNIFHSNLNGKNTKFIKKVSISF
jgi:hypothetical protein